MTVCEDNGRALLVHVDGIAGVETGGLDHQGGGNPANCGVGYAGGQPRRSDKAYIQVIRTRRHAKWEVEASLFLGPHQPKATHHTWLVDELDSRLTKKFGDDHRFMIKI